MKGDLVMRKVKVYNQTRCVQILSEAGVASDWLMRLKGLLGYSSLAAGKGLILIPCHSVHTIGMNFTIDVAFVDSSNEIIFLIDHMKPWRFSPIIRRSAFVIEAAAGEFKKTGTVVGDRLELA